MSLTPYSPAQPTLPLCLLEVILRSLIGSYNAHSAPPGDNEQAIKCPLIMTPKLDLPQGNSD